MDKKDAMKWVRALRSGKYKQGKAYLNNNGKFCCLGILCEISDVPKFKNEKNKVIYGKYGRQCALPSELTKKYKLKPFGNLDGGYALSSLNDCGKYNFDEIADIIQIEFVEGL